uniref:Uncharacterized protein n=1 Tax=Octopus bimaculoides TaxID=37653 RepID=A0A0L8G5W2_OCTBM
MQCNMETIIREAKNQGRLEPESFSEVRKGLVQIQFQQSPNNVCPKEEQPGALVFCYPLCESQCP